MLPKPFKPSNIECLPSATELLSEAESPPPAFVGFGPAAVLVAFVDEGMVATLFNGAVLAVVLFAVDLADDVGGDVWLAADNAGVVVEAEVLAVVERFVVVRIGDMLLLAKLPTAISAGDMEELLALDVVDDFAVEGPMVDVPLLPGVVDVTDVRVVVLVVVVILLVFGSFFKHQS